MAERQWQGVGLTPKASAGQGACEPCAPGLYQDSTQSTECLRCSAGKYATEPGEHGRLQTRVSGLRFHTDGCDPEASSSDVCISCAAGTFSTTWAASSADVWYGRPARDFV